MLRSASEKSEWMISRSAVSMSPDLSARTDKARMSSSVTAVSGLPALIPKIRMKPRLTTRKKRDMGRMRRDSRHTVGATTNE